MATFAEASIDAPVVPVDNPLLYVDLSTLPQAWWSAAGDTEGSRGYATVTASVDNPFGSRVPADFVNYDKSTQTGTLVVRFDGTLNTLQTYKLRVYAPQSGQDDNAPGSTYGENAVYQDYEWYWIDGSFRGGKGGDFVESGTVTPIPEVSGVIGNVKDFEASNNHAIARTGETVGNVWSLGAWFKYETVASTGVIGCRTSGDIKYQLDNQPAGLRVVVRQSGSLVAVGSGEVMDTNLHHAVAVQDGAKAGGLHLFYDKSASPTGNTTSITGIDASGFESVIGGYDFGGGPTALHDGLLGPFYLKPSAMNATEVGLEYDQQVDNSTYWGTWSVEMQVGGLNSIIGNGIR